MMCLSFNEEPGVGAEMVEEIPSHKDLNNAAFTTTAQMSACIKTYL